MARVTKKRPARKQRTRLSEQDKNLQELRAERKADGVQVMRELDEMYQQELEMAQVMIEHAPALDDRPCISDLMLAPDNSQIVEINFRASIARRECVCRLLAKHYQAKADDYAEFLRPVTLEDIYGDEDKNGESGVSDAN